MPIDACGPNYHAYLKGLSYIITALTNTLMKNMQTQTNRRKKSPLTELCFLMKHILGLGLLNVQNTFRSSWCPGIDFPTWLSPTAETIYLKKKNTHRNICSFQQGEYLWINGMQFTLNSCLWVKNHRCSTHILVY